MTSFVLFFLCLLIDLIVEVGRFLELALNGICIREAFLRLKLALVHIHSFDIFSLSLRVIPFDKTLFGDGYLVFVLFITYYEVARDKRYDEYSCRNRRDQYGLLFAST